MPIYEYKCKACGSEFEYQQRMSDPPKSECERCGGGLEKLISRTSFMLKGSGWYKDLYSSPKPTSEGASGSGDGASAGGGEGGASSGGGGESTSKEGSSTSKESASSSKDGAGKADKSAGSSSG